MPLLRGLRRAKDFLVNYTRKAGITGGIGAAVVTTMLNNLPEDSPSQMLAFLADLPWYISVPSVFALFWLVTYFPPNGPKPE